MGWVQSTTGRKCNFLALLKINHKQTCDIRQEIEDQRGLPSSRSPLRCMQEPSEVFFSELMLILVSSIKMLQCENVHQISLHLTELTILLLRSFSQNSSGFLFEFKQLFRKFKSIQWNPPDIKATWTRRNKLIRMFIFFCVTLVNTKVESMINSKCKWIWMGIWRESLFGQQ